MLLLPAFLLSTFLLACSAGDPPPPPGAPPETVSPGTTSPEKGSPEKGSPEEGPAAGEPGTAPSREIWGLKVGESLDADVLGWIARRGLACTTAPSPRRTIYRYSCVAGLTPPLLPDRRIDGVLAEILFVRGDETPLTHVSALRKYGTAEAAIADYDATIAAITPSLGAPARSMPAEIGKMGGALSFFSTAWSFSDLSVELRLLKAGGDFYSVSESWDLPGAGEEEEARPSSGEIPG